MSSQVVKQDTSGQIDHSAGQAQNLKQTDEEQLEHKASANAGLNLNLGAAVAGIFKGSRDKTTDTDADGKSHSTSKTQGTGHATGDGVANVSAVGGGETTKTATKRSTLEGSQEQFDHLGASRKNAIEGESVKK